MIEALAQDLMGEMVRCLDQSCTRWQWQSPKASATLSQYVGIVLVCLRAFSPLRTVLRGMDL